MQKTTVESFEAPKQITKKWQENNFCLTIKKKNLRKFAIKDVSNLKACNVIKTNTYNYY